MYSFMSGPEITISEHGGECCGITHLHDWPSSYEVKPKDRTEFVKKAISEALANQTNEKIFKHAIEAVLITSQVRLWGKHLLAAGFEKVYSFRNGNTGNICHVYYHTTGGGKR